MMNWILYGQSWFPKFWILHTLVTPPPKRLYVMSWSENGSPLLASKCQVAHVPSYEVAKNGFWNKNVMLDLVPVKAPKCAMSKTKHFGLYWQTVMLSWELCVECGKIFWQPSSFPPFCCSCYNFFVIYLGKWSIGVGFSGNQPSITKGWEPLWYTDHKALLET